MDELNAQIGWVRTCEPPDSIDAVLGPIQHDLFAIGGELAAVDPQKLPVRFDGQERIAALEATIDEFESQLEPLKQFILPYGSRCSCALHVARAVARRTERSVVALIADGKTISPEVLTYLNRLSDLLFVLARSANSHANVADVPWKQPRNNGS